MDTYSITSPIHITQEVKGRAVKTALNFNKVRNMQGFVYNRLKQSYKEIMLPKVHSLPKLNKIQIKYILYTGSAHKSDLMNWSSIIDKFFQDVLVEAGKLEDDNYLLVPKVLTEYGGLDKNNPRMEIQIKEIE